MVYRRNRERMPAHDDEVQEAEAEGITFRWLSTIDHFEDDGLTVEAYGARRAPASRSRPAAPSGSTADSVVLALGQETDLSLIGGGATSTSTTAW